MNFNGEVGYDKVTEDDKSVFHTKYLLLTFAGDAAEHREGKVAILLNCLSFLVIVAGARDGPIMGHPLLKVHTIVCFAGGTE